MRDVAEGRPYTLKIASEAMRRALNLAVEALDKEPSVALSARGELGATLALLKDDVGARAQYRAILDAQTKRKAPAPLVERTRALLAAVGGNGS